MRFSNCNLTAILSLASLVVTALATPTPKPAEVDTAAIAERQMDGNAEDARVIHFCCDNACGLCNYIPKNGPCDPTGWKDGRDIEHCLAPIGSFGVRHPPPFVWFTCLDANPSPLVV